MKEVARILDVDSTLVTTQSKILEAKDFVSRSASSEDARVVRLSLSEKSLKQLADLSLRQKKMTDYMFWEFTEQDVQALLTKVSVLKNTIEKASAIASLDFDH